MPPPPYHPESRHAYTALGGQGFGNNTAWSVSDCRSNPCFLTMSEKQALEWETHQMLEYSRRDGIAFILERLEVRGLAKDPNGEITLPIMGFESTTL